MCSGAGNWTWLQLGFPIRKSPDHSSVANFPGLIAGSYVLHRLLVPRHPPCALSSLSCYKDARVHCVVLKLRAVPPSSPALTARTSRPSRQFAERMVRRDRRARSLRTQQCAWNASPLGSRFRAGRTRRRDSTDELRERSRPNSRRSTSELDCRGTHVLETGRWTPSAMRLVPSAP